MPVEGSTLGTPSDDLEERSATLIVRARWYSVPEAARMLGISPTAVRKRIASGELTSLRAGRGRRVLLLGDDGNPMPAERAERSASRPTPDGEAEPRAHTQELEVLARTSESLTALVRDLQRQSLALAGQIGYLQHQLSQAHERVSVLEQSTTAPRVAQTGVDPLEHERLQRELMTVRQELDAARRASQPGSRGWRFWRRGAGTG